MSAVNSHTDRRLRQKLDGYEVNYSNKYWRRMERFMDGYGGTMNGPSSKRLWKNWQFLMSITVFCFCLAPSITSDQATPISNWAAMDVPVQISTNPLKSVGLAPQVATMPQPSTHVSKQLLSALTLPKSTDEILVVAPPAFIYSTPNLPSFLDETSNISPQNMPPLTSSWLVPELPKTLELPPRTELLPYLLLQQFTQPIIEQEFVPTTTQQSRVAQTKGIAKNSTTTKQNRTKHNQLPKLSVGLKIGTVLATEGRKVNPGVSTGIAIEKPLTKMLSVVNEWDVEHVNNTHEMNFGTSTYAKWLITPRNYVMMGMEFETSLVFGHYNFVEENGMTEQNEHSKFSPELYVTNSGMLSSTLNDYSTSIVPVSGNTEEDVPEVAVNHTLAVSQGGVNENIPSRANTASTASASPASATLDLENIRSAVSKNDNIASNTWSNTPMQLKNGSLSHAIGQLFSGPSYMREDASVVNLFKEQYEAQSQLAEAKGTRFSMAMGVAYGFAISDQVSVDAKYYKIADQNIYKLSFAYMLIPR